ncbi:molybdopterin molybdotransferase MoeA [Cohnella fermenti]|uniref:Molybdopterin molybdenumtransferase n=2 Tax=Cohnella fermenti TaxID=2565925 RepID=A0A4S4BPW3_9BACL|nr:molybdopterin molybdotransferase MoeA [Cohnella fermenti]
MRQNGTINDKWNRRTLTPAEATDRLLACVRPRTGFEEVPLAEAIGRRLAVDATTKEPIPHFRRAGMDGYAVRLEDVAAASSEEPCELEIVEHIPCGAVPLRKLERGQAARIMTGGMVPEGADAVVMQEMAEAACGHGREYVRIRKADPRGTHLTPIGEEAAEGTILLRAGQLIGAGEMADLATLGSSRVKVFRKPRVAILSTGTELLDVAAPLEPGKVRNSNAYMLAALIASAGGEAVPAGTVPDDCDRAERLLGELLASDADAVVATGGVSVGDYDIMADYFLRWEGTTLFNKVAMRPGSPTTAGVWKEKLLFGLSGNPSACFVGFELFVRPALLAMQRSYAAADWEFAAYLAEDYLKVNAYARYVRGRAELREGRVEARPIGLDQSSAVLSIKDANCLIVIPPTKSGIRRGELVKAIRLGGVIVP